MFRNEKEVYTWMGIPAAIFVVWAFLESVGIINTIGS